MLFRGRPGSCEVDDWTDKCLEDFEGWRRVKDLPSVGLLALLGENVGFEEVKETGLEVSNGLKKFEVDSSKLLKVKVSKLTLWHLGHIHWTWPALPSSS